MYVYVIHSYLLPYQIRIRSSCKMYHNNYLIDTTKNTHREKEKKK